MNASACLSRPFAAAGLLLTGLLASCGGSPPPAPDLEVRDAWVRPAAVPADTAAAPTNSAAYLTVVNHGKAADRLVGVGCPGARRAELHESFVDEAGVAKMRGVDGVPVPAGGEARLEPGGLHVMLMGLAESLVAGDTLELILRFETGGEVLVRAPVGGG